MKFQTREFQRLAKRLNVTLYPGVTMSPDSNPTQVCVVGAVLLSHGLNAWQRNELEKKIGKEAMYKLQLIENGFEGFDTYEKSAWNGAVIHRNPPKYAKKYFEIGRKLEALAN